MAKNLIDWYTKKSIFVKLALAFLALFILHAIFSPKIELSEYERIRYAAMFEAEDFLEKSQKAPDSYKKMNSDWVWEGEASDGMKAFVFAVEYEGKNSFNAILRKCALIAAAASREDGKTYTRLGNFPYAEDESRQACDRKADANDRKRIASKMAIANAYR